MTHIPYSPDYYRTKLYQKEKDFKNFENITEERLAKIAKKVYYRQENQENTPSNIFVKDKLTKYMETLTFLTNPQIHLDMSKYDERIIFLIMSTDPELVEFKEFLNSNITPMARITGAATEEERELLTSKRSAEVLNYTTRVREKIGFYDAKLLKYEEIYFKRFLREKELISAVKQNHINKLIATAPFITSFNSITEERYQELQSKAQIWLSTTNAQNDFFTAAYSCNNQSDVIGLETIFEKLVFLILVSDPNLDILRIFEEESKIPEVERRCKEAFNYYNPDLITLEKLYHQRFCPKKTLSPWTHI